MRPSKRPINSSDAAVLAERMRVEIDLSPAHMDLMAVEISQPASLNAGKTYREFEISALLVGGCRRL